MLNKYKIHPTALVENAQIGINTKIWAFAHILEGVKIGNDCNIGDHTYIETGAIIGNNVTLKNNVCVWEGITIEDDVFVGPNVAFTNDLYPRSPRMNEAKTRYLKKQNWLVTTVIGKGSSIGANATIIGQVKIGPYSMIAAGSTVTKSIEPFALVSGSPAKKVGYVCLCGEKLGLTFPSGGCPICATTYERIKDIIAKVEVD